MSNNIANNHVENHGCKDSPAQRGGTREAGEEKKQKQQWERENKDGVEGHSLCDFAMQKAVQSPCSSTSRTFQPRQHEYRATRKKWNLFRIVSEERDGEDKGGYTYAQKQRLSGSKAGNEAVDVEFPLSAHGQVIPQRPQGLSE